MRKSATKPRRFGGTVLKAAAAATLAMGGVFALAPSASASHKCAHGAAEELCVYRLTSYTGGSRAFYTLDQNYTNDYYDDTSVTRSLNNSITSYINYDNYWYFMECRYVSNESCDVGLPPNTYDTNLGNDRWADGDSMDNSWSSHYIYDRI